MEIVMYTKHYCGYCDAAKRLLNSRGLEFQEINVETASDPQAALAAMLEQGVGKTFPQLIINGQGIGGFTELQAYFSNNDTN